MTALTPEADRSNRWNFLHQWERTKHPTPRPAFVFRAPHLFLTWSSRFPEGSFSKGDEHNPHWQYIEIEFEFACPPGAWRTFERRHTRRVECRLPIGALMEFDECAI